MAKSESRTPPSEQPAVLESGTPVADEPTVGRLVADVSRDVSSLVRQEIELAKSELKVSVRHGGLGAGLFAGAAFLALLGIIMLSVAFAYFLHFTGLDLAWCFLIVFGVYMLLAGGLVFGGVRQIKRVGPPKRAIRQGQEIPNAFKRG
ncbi:phage holin family protein [Nocardioidaceae bacterium]|nr:phage holin family protein [Nocardioidaceae bacterium]